MRQYDRCKQTEQHQRTPRQTNSALTSDKKTHTHNRMIQNNAILKTIGTVDITVFF